MTTKREKRDWRKRLTRLPEKLEKYGKPEDELSQEERPPEIWSMSKEDRAFLVERKIQDAIAQGLFDNLPGQGKPLNLKKNPYLDPAMELAYNMLEKNGFAPEWIEQDKAIRKELETMRRQLRLFWEQRRGKPHHEARWQKAVAEFSERLVKLNRRIDTFNLTVPLLSLHKTRLQLEDELQQVQAE